VDWNNNYEATKQMCLLPLRQLGEGLSADIRIGTAPILGTCWGGKHSWRSGRPHPGGAGDLRRIGTDDLTEAFAPMLARVTSPTILSTPSEQAVVQIPQLPDLMRYICRNGFEHTQHDRRALCRGSNGRLGNYLGWNVLPTHKWTIQDGGTMPTGQRSIMRTLTFFQPQRLSSAAAAWPNVSPISKALHRRISSFSRVAAGSTASSFKPSSVARVSPLQSKPN